MDEPFTMIPNRIIDKLQMRGVAIYCYIARFNPVYYGSFVTMARAIGMDEKILKTNLDALIAMGYIKKTARPGMTNIYEIPNKFKRTPGSSPRGSKDLTLRRGDFTPRYPRDSTPTNKTTLNNIGENKKTTPHGFNSRGVSKRKQEKLGNSHIAELLSQTREIYLENMGDDK